MSQINELKTECKGCPSMLGIGNVILCVESQIEPDQPVEGCSDRGKGRRVSDISPQEINELKEHYEKGSVYDDPKIDPFERRTW